MKFKVIDLHIPMKINAAKNVLFKKTATFYTKENRRIYSISDLQLNILYVQVNVMIYLY